jgi:hypothetical protein
VLVVLSAVSPELAGSPLGPVGQDIKFNIIVATQWNILIGLSKYSIVNGQVFGSSTLFVPYCVGIGNNGPVRSIGNISPSRHILRGLVIGVAIIYNSTRRIKISIVPDILWHKWFIDDLAVLLSIDQWSGFDTP